MRYRIVDKELRLTFWSMLLAGILVLMLWSCSADDQQISPFPTDSTEVESSAADSDVSDAESDTATVTAIVPFEASAELQSANTNPISTLTPTPAPVTIVAPTPIPTATPVAVPTPLVSQTAWVQDRISAVIDIWGFTDAGKDWLSGYDLRQMVGEPGWFGSYGFESWAGVGQAIPRSVLHELLHSYWGAFPVVDGEKLDWSSRGSGGVSEGIAQLHADLHEFMMQPTDRYEPLRDRFRNMPNLIGGSYPDLYHFGEAQLVYMTGGNLDLLPPILRKYFSSALSKHGVGAENSQGFSDWGDALGWYLSLSDSREGVSLSDHAVAHETFGIQHFPLAPYLGTADVYRESIGDDSDVALMSPVVRNAVESEEIQRLVDFADQFSLVKSEHDEGGEFNFWGSYLSQMRGLYSRYPSVLASQGDIGLELAVALDGYIEVESLDPDAQAVWFNENSHHAFVADFAVLLKPFAIMILFSDSDSDEGLEGHLGFKARSLEEIVRPVDEITSMAARDLDAGIAMLDEFLLTLDEDRLRGDVGLIFDLVRGAGDDVATALLSNLSDATYARLFDLASHVLTHREIPVKRALASIGVDESFDAPSFESGLQFYADHSSGNFALDARIESEIIRLLEFLSRNDASRAFAALVDSGLRIEPWILSEQHSLAMIRRSIPHAAHMFMDVEGPRETPAGLIHTLMRIDAVTASDLMIHIVDEIDSDFGVDVISNMAYDAYWRSKGASLSPDAVASGVFLDALIDYYGRGWLDDQIAVAVARAEADESAGKRESGFADNLRWTLREGFNVAPDID